MYFLWYSYLLLTSWAIIYLVSGNLMAVLTGWISIKFDTAPLCESTLLRKAPVILQREFRKRYRIWSGRRYTRPRTTDPWTRPINAGGWKSWKRWALFFFFLIWFSCIVGIIKTMWLVCYRRSEEKHRLACVFLYILTHFLCAFCNWSTGTPRSSLRIAVA